MGVQVSLLRPSIGMSNRHRGPGAGMRSSSGLPLNGVNQVGLSGPAIRGDGMMQFDDMGLDEYDVADERQHEIGFDRWELNLDNMTYEELLSL